MTLAISPHHLFFALWHECTSPTVLDVTVVVPFLIKYWLPRTNRDPRWVRGFAYSARCYQASKIYWFVENNFRSRGQDLAQDGILFQDIPVALNYSLDVTWLGAELGAESDGIGIILLVADLFSLLNYGNFLCTEWVSFVVLYPIFAKVLFHLVFLVPLFQELIF